MHVAFFCGYTKTVSVNWTERNISRIWMDGRIHRRIPGCWRKKFRWSRNCNVEIIVFKLSPVTCKSWNVLFPLPWNREDWKRGDIAWLNWHKLPSSEVLWYQAASHTCNAWTSTIWKEVERVLSRVRHTTPRFYEIKTSRIGLSRHQTRSGMGTRALWHHTLRLLDLLRVMWWRRSSKDEGRAVYWAKSMTMLKFKALHCTL